MFCIFIIIVISLLLDLYHFDEIVIESDRFRSVLKSSAYVDKTLLLKHVFKHKYMLITAPSKFLKSTNMDMMKMFLAVPSNTSGDLLLKSESRRYKMFKKLNIYKQEREFFENHFGTYAVIHLRLEQRRPLQSLDDVGEAYREALHYSFLEHKHICKNRNLKEGKRTACRMWCRKRDYPRFWPRDVLRSLKLLCHCMFKYYNTKIILLVDEFDTVFNEVMFDFTELDLNRTKQLLYGRIRKIVKNKHVERVIISGVSHIVGSYGFDDISELVKYRFLHEHEFIDFYGFLESEVYDLFDRLKVNETLTEEIRIYYNGYESVTGRKKIYSPYSILSLLKRGFLEGYWHQVFTVDRLPLAYELGHLKPHYKPLLSNMSVPIEVSEYCTLEDIVQLRNMFLKPRKKAPALNVNMLYTHLLELGYLCYAGQFNSSTVLMKIPNDEIWTFMRFYAQGYSFN